MLEQTRTWSLAVVAIIMAVAALKLTQEVAVPAAIACLSALILTPACDVLEKLRVPRPAAAFAMVVGSLFALISLVYGLAPEAHDWKWRARELARNAERALRDLSEEVSDNTGLETEEVAEGASDLVDTGQSLLTDALVGAPSIFAGFLFAAFLTFFLISERRKLWRTALYLGSTPHNSLSIGRTIIEIRHEVGHYLFSITSINVTLGLIAGLLFYAVGLPNPMVLAVGVCLMNFIPYLGPMIMNAVVLIVGVSFYGTIEQALLPTILLAGLNLVEGNVVTPSIVGHRSRVSALAVFLVVVFGAWLWGPAGAIMATPVLIVGRTVFLRFAKKLDSSGFRNQRGR